MADARRAALTVLERCRRSGAWSDAALGGVMDAEGLTGADRGLCAALCYGVIQNADWLDYAVGRCSDVPLSRVEPKVLDILRLSLYQLAFLERVPAYAAVSAGVELCRRSGCARAAGYVNAVLRRLAALERLPEPEGGTLSERLSVRYSHPIWMTEYLLDRLGEEETRRFLEADNAAPPAALQANPLKCTAEALAARLAEEGVETEAHPCLPGCLLSKTPGAIARCASFRDGWFWVQDPAARQAVLAAAPKPGERVLDLCAAPGGKSFAAAAAAEGKAEIVACDLHENKLKRIREGAERLGFAIETHAADARVNRPEWNGAFDLVIADVPCSGLGVIAKKPDIRRKDPAGFAGLPEIQSAILRNAARYVRPGGRLVYSTCTVRGEENEAVVRRFREETEDFAPLEFSTVWGDASRDGMLQLWPQRQGTDGFFIALTGRTNK